MTTVDPDLDYEFELWDELRPAIAEATLNDERSLQVEIGPSGLGTPCVRKLAHRLAHTAPVNTGDVPWRPTVGKAVHTWLEGVLSALNETELAEAHANNPKRCKVAYCRDNGGVEPYGAGTDDDGWPVAPGAVHTQTGWHLLRYMTEWEVPVGTINGRTIMGHIDFYDRVRKIIGDWKISGPGALKDHHAKGMSPEYRVQGHTYGRGVVRVAKLPVERIALCFLPMNGELRQGFVQSEVFDPSVGAEAFRRARVVETAITEAVEADTYELGADDDSEPLALRALFAKLKTAPDYCARCPWFSPGARDFEASCPGDKSIYEGDPGDNEFSGLI